jgi:hypothetical protein
MRQGPSPVCPDLPDRWNKQSALLAKDLLPDSAPSLPVGVHALGPGFDGRSKTGAMIFNASLNFFFILNPGSFLSTIHFSWRSGQQGRNGRVPGIEKNKKNFIAYPLARPKVRPIRQKIPSKNQIIPLKPNKNQIK